MGRSVAGYSDKMKKLKAIILAAGPGHTSQTADSDNALNPWVLQNLGDRTILDYVINLAHHHVTPDDIYLVISKRQNSIETHLGESYHYVEQPIAQGTGHAVAQARAALEEFDGSLLILHGDRPFFRRSTILGLIHRHRLKQASLTLVTGHTDRALKAGRIIRSQTGNIVDIIEDQHASSDVQQITEFNMGVYIVEANVLWPALEQVVQSHQYDRGIPFTACIRRLIQSGSVIESYRVLDEDELQGINTADDLAQASLILEKRQLRPRRVEEHNIIRFGTGGWRALIGEGFTLDNVRRLCQALANDVIRQTREKDGVLIGFDRRFLADTAAKAASEVFAGNGIPVQLLPEAVPTPLVTYATAEENVAYGLMFTASHNPPEWNGLKVFATDGSLPLDNQIEQIEQEANATLPSHVVKIDLDTALRSGMVREVDYTNEYVDAVEALIDLHAIRCAKLRVAVDPMYGVGQNALQIVLTEARCRMDTIHSRHDPLFGGRSPAPDPGALDLLRTTVCDGGYDLGLAMDGDADRIAIIDRNGNYVTTNELLILLYYYLHWIKGLRGGVTRNLATTHLLDRLAAHFGERCYEVPVGFKHIGASMKEHDVLLAGESSGGLSIRGHILGKDGIFACALVVEMIARTGRSISDMMEEIYAAIGGLVSREVNVPATPDMKIVLPRKLAESAPKEIAGCRVVKITTTDGTKFYLEHDNWLLLRFSGTEPLLRIFAEADTNERVDALLEWARSLM